MAGICERTPVPTGASLPSPARRAAHDHIATPATIVIQTQNDLGTAVRCPRCRADLRSGIVDCLSGHCPGLRAYSVTAIDAAVITIMGLAALPRWGYVLYRSVFKAFLTFIVSAITDTKYRTISLWASNAFLIALEHVT